MMVGPIAQPAGCVECKAVALNYSLRVPGPLALGPWALGPWARVQRANRPKGPIGPWPRAHRPMAQGQSAQRAPWDPQGRPPWDPKGPPLGSQGTP